MDERTGIPLDAETKVSERPDDHKTELRLWLRLLTCTTLIETEVKTLEKNIWDAAALHTEQGYLCNSGAAACTLGTKGKMTLVKPSAADVALLKKIVDDTMVPTWAGRCSAECVAGFNDTIGKVMGIKAAKK